MTEMQNKKNIQGNKEGFDTLCYEYYQVACIRN